MLNMARLGVFVAIGLVALVFAAEAKEKKTQSAKATADYFPLQVGYKWTYQVSEEGGYTLNVLNEEPPQGGPVRYIVELLSGVKIHRVYSKADDWILFHSENYSEHE